MKLLDMKSEEEEEILIDDDLENSPTFAPKSRSRRNLMLCETSVTVPNSTINNLPKSPIARRELWPQASSRSGKATPESEREETRRNLDHLLKQQLPKVDQEDADAAVAGLGQRQAAPEYSQTAYMSTLRLESSVGNYFRNNSKTNKILTPAQRGCMMRFVQKVHDIMKFKEESLYVAANIADRYLANLTAQSNFNLKEKPCLMTLAVASILLA